MSSFLLNKYDDLWQAQKLLPTDVQIPVPAPVMMLGDMVKEIFTM
jgi:hypothetical protein